PGSMATVAENLARVGVADAVELVQGEALATLTAMALNGSLREAGLIVLDDNHDYEHVLAEMRACWLVLPPLGVIAGHDVYVDGLEGVNRAFLEISQQPNAHLVLSPHSQGYGLLQKRNAKDSCPWK
ncbi:MAG TPA: class I SAM-dependent methyltransferase, partial [Pirellulales bacterium]|nr:class I SAM-dependent methyltransferase [Pirellulales bacterium]